MQNIFSRHKVGFLGASVHQGQRRPGVENGPKALRQSGFIPYLNKNGIKVFDYGDVNLENTNEVSQVYDLNKTNSEFYIYERLYKMTKSMAQQHEFSLIVGGDHSMSISTISALNELHPNLGIIWIDAHGDFNTPSSSPSGNLHGMPVSALTGLFDIKTVSKDFSWFKNKIKPENFVIIGVRDIDEDELKLLDKNNIKYFTMDTIDKNGLNKVIQESYDHLEAQGCETYHVSFDIDGLDPLFAPATGTPVNKGLTLDDTKMIIKPFKRSGKLKSLEIVEFNPELASDANELNITLTSIKDVASFSLRNPVRSITGQVREKIQ